MRYQSIIRFMFLFAVVVSFAQGEAKAFFLQSETANPKYDDWLKTDGNKQLFKVRMDVFHPDGKPAEDLQIQFKNPRKKPARQEHAIVENRISVWLETGDNGFFPPMQIKTGDGRFMANVTMQGQDIRKHCANGMRVDLVPICQIRVHVVDKNSRPAANARLVDHGTVTDAQGNAFIEMPRNEFRYRFSVIGSEGDVGVLKLYDKPDQAKASVFEIQLTDKYAKRTIRLLDEKGNRAKHVGFTPQPMDRKIDVVAEFGYPVISDENGEVKVLLIPGPPRPDAHISINGPEWFVTSQDRTEDIWTVSIRRLARKRVEGKVILPAGVKGGFGIQFTSYDHPTENRVDSLLTRTDDEGNFSIDALPNAVYCVYVVDSQYFSSKWDGVLVESDGTTNEPKLTVTPGTPIRVVATLGEGNSPMANTVINLSQEHSFRGKSGNGISGPRWNTTTDENGVAEAFAGIGRLKANIYSPNYNDSKSLTVKNDGDNEIHFHRKSTEVISISGKLIPVSDGSNNIANVDISVHATGGKTKFSATATTSGDGRFGVKGMGERFAVFAIAKDKSAAGFVFASQEEAKALAIELEPTGSFKGRLIDAENNPLVDCDVTMEVQLTDPDGEELGFYSSSKLVATFTEKTNGEGEFNFTGVPVSVPLSLRIDDPQVVDESDRYLGQHMLLGLEKRPILVRQIGRTSKPREKESLESRLARLQSFAEANSAQALIVILGENKTLTDFSEEVLDFQSNSDVFSYFPLVVSHETSQRKDVLADMKARKWEQPAPNQVCMVVIDAAGEVVGQIAVDADNFGIELANEFLAKHKGETKDAKDKLDEALKKAKSSGRKVWLTTGHTRCAPCLYLGSWLKANRKILEKDYLFVKVDTARDENAHEVSDLITRGKRHGVPFFAILDDASQVLVDSEGPLGNIGFPGGGYESSLHLRKMLTETAVNLTPSEIDSLVESCKKFER